MADSAAQELDHRRSMWARLREAGGPRDVAPLLLREMGIYGGAQGIWVDKARTAAITAAGEGVTVALLHTGSSYADDLSADGVLYHYPLTNRPVGRDAGEVNATKAAARLGLPVFVITYPTPNSSRRNVDLAWVEGWEDASRLFLISFGERRPAILTADKQDEASFQLFGADHRVRREVTVRPGQQRFKFQVLQRYGPACAVCELRVPELLDAAHIGPKSAAGCDDPRNGLILCANHHRAFDAGLIGFEPDSLVIRCRPDGPGAAAIGVTCKSLNHLPRKPHKDAVAWHWKNWCAEGGDALVREATK